ncbi:MAG: IS1634 family transposase [Clostridiales bacterium]|nr:IS1634 family transposase [Clostridiales bacterium]
MQSIETHIANGIADPVAHFQKEVDALNNAKKEDSVRKISDKSPVHYLGYFPLKSLMTRLQIKKYVDYFKLTNEFEYDLFELLSSLVYARSVNPCSKLRTFHDVLPYLYHEYNFSYDQLLAGLGFIGRNYRKFVELFTVQTNAIFGLDTDNTYFDCTNFYFEIDREDDFRKRGPSKENKKEPIVGLGLLLDKNQIPIGMKLYPGNESEKPIMRNVIDELKNSNNIKGRTIHVADKGLNCAQNIAFSKKHGDGYLFSKSVKGLPQKEREWVLLENGFTDVKDKKGNTIYRYKSCIDTFPYTFEFEGKTVTVQLTEKRLLTYNPKLATKKRYEINRLVEKARSLAMSQAKKSQFGESGKYVNFTDKDGKKAVVGINEEAIEKDLKFAGYNLLVTSETKMKDEEMYQIYHNLWRIEESFKIMKSDLDARPVFARTTDAIKGHFLICYITVLLERIFQFKVLENKYSSSDIFSLIKGFKVTKAERKHINTTTESELINDLSDKFDLPLNHYFLSDKQIQSILNYII